jgi:hypothetical protein
MSTEPLMTPPFSQSCENNKRPILAVLRHCFATSRRVLEIGSGTAQHAVFFAKHLPHLSWQCSDRAEYLPGIEAQLSAHADIALPPPLALDVSKPWPLAAMAPMDALFSANTLHIMSKPEVEAFFTGLGKAFTPNTQRDGLGKRLALYGPFNYQGQFTSDSNRQFDDWLKQRDPLSAIRDVEWIVSLAQAQGFKLMQDNPMPANNRLLHFQQG